MANCIQLNKNALEGLKTPEYFKWGVKYVS